jgi:hypothetical protein
MTTPRRRLLGITGTVFTLLAALLVMSPSSAASHSGEIRIKGPGSLYSGNGAFVSEAVSVGATDKFELQVVNTGATLAQYNIKVSQFGLPANVNLYAGTLALTPLSSSPDGYYTSPIAPGKSQALVLKVAIPSGSPQDSVQVGLILYATDGSALGYVTAQTNVKAPTYGTSAYDVFAKQGSQPYIGGSVDAQATSSPALKVGDAAAFTVKLQNDGPAPAAVHGYLEATLSCATLTVKDGTTDVSEALIDDSYVTPVLAVHAAKTLKVTFVRTGASGCNPYDYGTIYAHDTGFANFHYAYLIASYPAT